MHGNLLDEFRDDGSDDKKDPRPLYTYMLVVAALVGTMPLLVFEFSLGRVLCDWPQVNSLGKLSGSSEEKVKFLLLVPTNFLLMLLFGRPVALWFRRKVAPWWYRRRQVLKGDWKR